MYPLGTEVGDESVVVVIVNNWIHDLMNFRYLSKNGGTVRFGEVAGNSMVNFADVLGEDYVEVYDVLVLVGVIAADGVNDLLEGTHHLDQVYQSKHSEGSFFLGLHRLGEGDGTPFLEIKFVVIQIFLRDELVEG